MRWLSLVATCFFLFSCSGASASNEPVSAEATVLELLFGLHDQANSPFLIRVAPNRWGAIQLWSFLSMQPGQFDPSKLLGDSPFSANGSQPAPTPSSPVSTKQIEVLRLNDASTGAPTCHFKVRVFDENDSPITVYDFDFSPGYKLVVARMDVANLPGKPIQTAKYTGRAFYKMKTIDFKTGIVSADSQDFYQYPMTSYSSEDSLRQTLDYFSKTYCPA
jgi:hypothetical protein